MKILVTGTAGFIGADVALALLERGDDVVGVDDLPAFWRDGPGGLQRDDSAVLDQHVPDFLEVLGGIHNKAAGDEETHGQENPP